MRKKCIIFTLLVMYITSIIPKPASAAAGDLNYVDAFAKSILFYEANWCGPDAGENRIKWRGPCHIEDGKDVGLDLTGGFHDCGDHVKFGLPQCTSASALAWAYYEFKDTFIEKGQDKYMLNIVKHFADYFMKCFPNKTTFYYQLGDGDEDHKFWGPPELQTYNRPAYYAATPSNPGSDVAGSAAATLALTYLNMKDSDPTYAAKCLTYAKDLYAFGQAYRGNSKGQSYYLPRSYYDELMWGGIWLYIATNEQKYMDDIEKLMAEKGLGGDNTYQNHWTNCWDDIFGGVALKMAEITKKPKYITIVEENLDYFMNSLSKVPGGLSYLDSWGVAKYPAAESMLALTYYKIKPDQKYLDYAKSQIDFILGKNPNNMSYMVGFGDKYPKFPHHRAASGMLEGPPADEKKVAPERHILYGALVGGPDKSGVYYDDIDQYVYTETGLDYNAGLVGALAGMSKYFGDGQKPEPTPGIEGDPDLYYAEAKIYKQDAQSTVIDLNMYNILTAPPRYETGLSFRYFMDLSELVSANVDPASTKADIYYSPIKGAKYGDVKVFDKAKNIYYIEFSFPNEKLYSRSYIQFCLANYSGKWNAANDYSIADLSATKYTRTDKIAIYKDGVKVAGLEPGETPIPSTTKPTNTPVPSSTVPKTKGYIAPDFTYSASAASKVKEGFEIHVTGNVSISATTDENGYFEITNPILNSLTFDLIISKPGYLTRIIKDIPTNKNTTIGTSSSPAAVWAGDITKGDVQDGAINMADVIEIAKAFNATSDTAKYVAEQDFNADGSINMSDILIIAKHFSMTSSNYPEIVIQ
ncbi:glycoside hydrolase family 9 protein [Pseudobacteroides cellulosolvens]|uniref:Cellulase n=1 Tax=Pseudobacteroides cellulosolvens ATCC 35603 = DSM 2933 TaxID=398512 RepID=A0A0L6JIK3_9FIRM|nr:Cellulase [Pseudobacteroides cellulosolvens ATCC 35603 = DSM 2933]